MEHPGLIPRGSCPGSSPGPSSISLRSPLADLSCQDPAGHPGPGATARQGPRPHRTALLTIPPGPGSGAPSDPRGWPARSPCQTPQLPDPGAPASRRNPTHSMTIGCRARNSGLPALRGTFAAALHTRPRPRQVRRRIGHAQKTDVMHARTHPPSPGHPCITRSARNHLSLSRVGRPRLRWVTRRMMTSVQKLQYLDSLCLAGQGGQGLLRAPQKPRKPATRRLIPAGIPRAERHTPVRLLCVLKVRRNAGDQG